MPQQLVDMVKQYWYIVVLFAVIVVGTLIANILRAKKTKSSNQSFLQLNPDAAKIYLTSKALVTSEAVQVLSVDGEIPQIFLEKGKTGFYVRPGNRVCELNYTYTRPGVMYKTVTKSTGVVQKELLTEPNQSYILGFDRDAQVFTFTEFSES
jgi:hypothetical protein